MEQFFYSRFYPIMKKNSAAYKYRALIGLGGNVGDVKKRFRDLYMYLLRYPRLAVIETSPILRNPPFGYATQADFYNAVMLVETSMAPKELLKFVLHVEKIFGRIRSFRNAPRTLDLDIILFEHKQYKQKNLLIPHPHWRERRSVLRPMEMLQNDFAVQAYKRR